MGVIQQIGGGLSETGRWEEHRSGNYHRVVLMVLARFLRERKQKCTRPLGVQAQMQAHCHFCPFYWPHQDIRLTWMPGMRNRFQLLRGTQSHISKAWIKKNEELGPLLSSIHYNLKLWKAGFLVQYRWLCTSMESVLWLLLVLTRFFPSSLRGGTVVLELCFGGWFLLLACCQQQWDDS